MPLYEFTCKKCGHVFEELMTVTEMTDSKTTCPVCKSKRVVKGFSAFATSGEGGSGVFGGGGSSGGCGSGGFT